MDALSVWDVADDGVGIRIENHGVSAARDVDAAGVTVHVDIVPATFAADGDGLDDVIAGSGRSRRCSVREGHSRKDNANGECTENRERRKTVTPRLFSLWGAGRSLGSGATQYTTTY